MRKGGRIASDVFCVCSGRAGCPSIFYAGNMRAQLFLSALYLQHKIREKKGVRKVHRMRRVYRLALLCILALLLAGCGRRTLDESSFLAGTAKSLDGEGVGSEEADDQTEENAGEQGASGEESSKQAPSETEGKSAGSSSAEASAPVGAEESKKPSGTGEKAEKTDQAGNFSGDQKDEPGQSGNGNSNAQKNPAPPETEPEEAQYITCTISIDCQRILEHMDQLKAGHESFVPQDGWLLKETSITVKKGATVYDALRQACEKNGLMLDCESTQYGIYIAGIQQLHEKDCGNSSGWTYEVNGQSAHVGCSSYKLSGNEQIRWRYTCSLGHDF